MIMRLQSDMKIMEKDLWKDYYIYRLII